MTGLWPGPTATVSFVSPSLFVAFSAKPFVRTSSQRANQVRPATMVAFASRSGANTCSTWTNHISCAVSSSKISRAQDEALDRAFPDKHTGLAGLSVRNGPVVDDDMDIDAPVTNGASKRKSRSSINKVSYRDDSESDDGAPLVGDAPNMKNCCGA